jgi:general stress protein YciG
LQFSCSFRADALRVLLFLIGIVRQVRSFQMEMAETTTTRGLRGFASMDKEKQREIASKGGRAAHEKGTAHEFSSNEASMAAKRGHERGTAHEFSREEARIAGRKGGLARAHHHGRPAEDSSSMVPASEAGELAAAGVSSAPSA